MPKNVKDKHITALDGLRGAAALSVIVVHCDELDYIPHIYSFGGVLGVTIFFYAERLPDGVSARGAGVRRGDGMVLCRQPRRADCAIISGVILFSWAFRQYVDKDFIYDINNHNLPRHLLFMGSERVFWTIPPEIQFYAFFLLMCFSLAMGRQGRYWPALLTRMAIIAMFMVAGRLPGTTLPTKLAFFLGGALAGLASRALQRRTINAWSIDTAQMVLLIVVPVYAARLFFISDMEETVYHSIPYAVLCAAMILAFSLPGHVGRSLFGNRAMQAVGAWSFALYLLHEPALYWASRL
jgi:peptidoglycan/LPS O-acetylase OafA/YrhL